MKEEKIKSFFNDLINSPEQFSEFSEVVEQSLGFFQQMVSDLKNGSTQERAQINRTLKEIEENISKEFDKVCEQAGISREDLEKFVSDPKNFDPGIIRKVPC